MKVVEQFGSIQGEGKYLGVPSYFIRTTGCNLRCTWKNPDNTITKCDTPYTSFNPEKGKDFDNEQLERTLKYSPIEHIVLTGGEPLIQPDIAQVVEKLNEQAKYQVTIETNGTVFKDIPNAFMSISPKLSNSYAQEHSKDRQLHQKNNVYMENISKWMKTNDYQLKFVVNERKDMEEIYNLVRSLDVPHNKVYLMPQGITTEQFKNKENFIFEEAMKGGFNYTPRLHIELFGNKRGI